MQIGDEYKPRKELDDEVNLLLSFSRGAETRRQILKALLLRPKNCNQIAKEIKVDGWTVLRKRACDLNRKPFNEQLLCKATRILYGLEPF